MGSIDYRTLMVYPLTQSYVESRVKSDLGSPQRIFELDAMQMAGAIVDALNTFNRYKSRTFTGGIPSFSGDMVIDFAISEGVMDIQKVDFVLQSEANMFNMDVFRIDEIVKYHRLSAGTMFEFKNWREISRKIFNSDNEWYYDYESRKLYLKAPGGPWGVMWTIFKPFSLDSIPFDYADTCLKLVKGFCKLRLADIRGKSDIVLPSGMSDSGSSKLVEEGTKLIDEAKSTLEEPVPPIT